jgi:HKD family nuclease
MDYLPYLNEQTALLERLGAALEGADRLEFAVAYARSSGAGQLLSLDVPSGSRAVVGLGFGLSDPIAVEHLADVGLDVRCVIDSTTVSATQFHPKLYMASRPRCLTVLSGSANLTGGGLASNVEQYEELTFNDPSPAADRQRARFETLWDYGILYVLYTVPGTGTSIGSAHEIAAYSR